jgi:hypothetical protein
MRKGSFCATWMVGAILVSQTGMSQQMIPLEEAVKEAAGRSTLAAPGAAPFHLQATISDEKTHDPQYEAEVEEWWQSPAVWRREFHSLAFSQTRVVNGNKVQGQSFRNCCAILRWNWSTLCPDSISWRHCTKQ